MTISNNGFDCEEMYGQPCVPELEAVRNGAANYVCTRCGALTFGRWPSREADCGSEGDA